MQAAPPHSAVAGSVNADLVFSLQRVPRAGETLAARGLAVHPGGKVLVTGGSLPPLVPLRFSRPSHLPLTPPPRSMPQGGNQAAAAARLGVPTKLVAQLGRDAQAHM